MNRGGDNISSLLVILAGLALATAASGDAAAAAPQVAAGLVGASIGRSEKPKSMPMVLINVDEEIAGYIGRAEEMVARKDYAGVIDILQALLDRTGQCFVPTDDPRRFVSLSVKVHEVIGQLPPEGVELYRRMYDARSERLFRIAAGRLDESALRDIIRRYFHTSYGDDALDLLGTILFDRGEFSKAAHCWRRIIYAYVGGQSAIRNPQSAILLSKVVVAHHLAGESALAAKAVSLLAERHPKVRAALGGREENVVAFTRRMLLKPSLLGVRRIRQDWPCLAGAPDSVAVMSPCRPAPDPRWTVPGGRLQDNPNIKAALADIPRAGGRDMALASASLREGRIAYTMRAGRTGEKTRQDTMEALIHPIVVGKTVLYRSAAGVVALDLLTGERLWESLPFPMCRSGGSRRYHVRYPGTVDDRGKWTLTAGGEKVFAVGEFRPWSKIYYYLGGGRNPAGSGDNSALAAFSISGQGRLIWRVGRGGGEDDLLRGAKFLGAPTYADGRVYAVIEYKQDYHLVCLDADNGKLVWKAGIGSTPIVSRHYRKMGYLQGLNCLPAVAGGRVFITTNTGVISAYDVATGRLLWAYQYDRAMGFSAPANPVIVTAGRAIFLPADCKRLLAVRADTGRLAWSIDRRGQRNLAAVDSSRLLLSGGGIVIVDAATGKEVWTAKDVSGVHGRPAVTTDAILASGKGEIIRVSLKDFSVTRLPIKRPDAILGNLICVDGKLLAANAAGVSAYFPSTAPARKESGDGGR